MKDLTDKPSMRERNDTGGRQFVLSASPRRHYCGWELKRLAPLAVLDRPAHLYLRELHQRIERFISLATGLEDCIFDFRLMTAPCSGDNRLTCMLLCRFDLPFQIALERANEWHRVVRASFEEHEFELVTAGCRPTSHRARLLHGWYGSRYCHVDRP